MANDALKPLALTLGEPAGIGPDITIAAWLRRRRSSRITDSAMIQTKQSKSI